MSVNSNKKPRKYDSIKRSYYAFKNAEREFNKRKVKLSQTYCSLLHKCAKQKDMKMFDSIAEDYITDLGEPYRFSVISIKVLYGIE